MYCEKRTARRRGGTERRLATERPAEIAPTPKPPARVTHRPHTPRNANGTVTTNPTGHADPGQDPDRTRTEPGLHSRGGGGNASRTSKSGDEETPTSKLSPSGSAIVRPTSTQPIAGATTTTAAAAAAAVSRA